MLTRLAAWCSPGTSHRNRARLTVRSSWGLWVPHELTGNRLSGPFRVELEESIHPGGRSGRGGSCQLRRSGCHRVGRPMRCDVMGLAVLCFRWMSGPWSRVLSAAADFLLVAVKAPRHHRHVLLSATDPRGEAHTLRQVRMLPHAGCAAAFVDDYGRYNSEAWMTLPLETQTATGIRRRSATFTSSSQDTTWSVSGSR